MAISNSYVFKIRSYQFHFRIKLNFLNERWQKCSYTNWMLYCFETEDPKHLKDAVFLILSLPQLLPLQKQSYKQTNRNHSEILLCSKSQITIKSVKLVKYLNTMEKNATKTFSAAFQRTSQWGQGWFSELLTISACFLMFCLFHHSSLIVLLICNG